MMDAKNLVLTLTILDTALRVLERQEAIRKAFAELRDEIAEMLKEGRDPSAAEWAALEARFTAASQTLEERAAEAQKLIDG
jgi:CRISPR/Cas system-associated exonuclease Cas4 (RecB family)